MSKMVRWIVEWTPFSAIHSGILLSDVGFVGLERHTIGRLRNEVANMEPVVELCPLGTLRDRALHDINHPAMNESRNALRIIAEVSVTYTPHCAKPLSPLYLALLQLSQTLSLSYS